MLSINPHHSPSPLCRMEPITPELDLKDFENKIAETFLGGLQRGVCVDTMAAEIFNQVRENPELGKAMSIPQDYVVIRQAVDNTKKSFGTEAGEGGNQKRQVTGKEMAKAFLTGLGCGLSIVALETPLAPLGLAGAAVSCTGVLLTLESYLKP